MMNVIIGGNPKQFKEVMDSYSANYCTLLTLPMNSIEAYSCITPHTKIDR